MEKFMQFTEGIFQHLIPVEDSLLFCGQMQSVSKREFPVSYFPYSFVYLYTL